MTLSEKAAVAVSLTVAVLVLAAALLERRWPRL